MKYLDSLYFLEDIDWLEHLGHWAGGLPLGGLRGPDEPPVGHQEGVLHGAVDPGRGRGTLLGGQKEKKDSN